MPDNKDRKILRRVFGKVKNLPDFIMEYYNNGIDDLNTMLRGLSLVDNFNSQYLKDIEIATSSSLKIDHKLGIVPSHRLVVKQVGGGLITDGEYTKNYIELTNTGGSATTISVIIFKE